MWVVGVIAAALMPRGLKQLTHTTGPLHHTLHFLAFAGIALGPSSWARRLGGKLVVSASVIGLGALLEVLQHYFYGNAYEWADLRDDSFGAIVGSLVLPAVAVLTRMAAPGIDRFGCNPKR
jgi:VanZ family protein